MPNASPCKGYQEHSKKSMRAIACSVLRKEIDFLCESGQLDIEVEYLSSILHIHPHLLEKQLAKRLDDTDQCLLVYGDCHARMFDMTQVPGIGRPIQTNCCELLLGHDKYIELASQRVFFVLPEWAVRWKTVFIEELGLGDDNIKNFMEDMHTKLLYLDTGLVPVPENLLTDMSDYTGLPWEVMKVSLDTLLETLKQTMEEIHKR